VSNVYAAFDFSALGFIQLLIRKAHPPRACFVRTRKRLTTNEHEWTLIKRERTTDYTDTTNIVGRLCQTLACSNTGMSETTDYIDRTDWGMVAATTTFESLAVASRPLQRRPR
jgi:hypothetical protein